ncbi:MAG: NAD-dependent epimerase/dehydratase family protein [Candidatus Hydrogenedentes bacterium]|nr:NAD-dependent epimerase/dehydratase family protein [Candidatus Hydrogenedentota bacterium]
MRVLVLGGTGLISTAIVERLLHTGHDVVLFNRGRTPARFAGNVTRIQGDRQDFGDFQHKVTTSDYDAVIDMITFDPRTAAHAVEVFQGRVSQYLFCSTVCVYGGPLTTIPAHEDEPLRPVSDYGRGKRDAEQVFMTAWEQSEFPVTIFRPSHCYGPGAPLLDIWGYNASLVSRIREGRPILIPGDGRGLWQPGFVGDMAKGFVGAVGCAASLGMAYNIVGDEIMDWRTFHERMARAIGCEANLVCMTTSQLLAGAPDGAGSMLEVNFQYHAAYTNERLKADVPDFSGLLPWEDGVRRTVEWMDSAGVHEPSDSRPWIDRLAKEASAFERKLAKG